VSELWEAKNYGIIDELCAPEFVAHDLPGKVPANRHGLQMMAKIVGNAFPDATIMARDVIAENDKVVLRWDSTGTHKGAFMGIAETNQKVSWSGITIYRITGGKIMEWWNKSDLLNVMQQLK
jgi:predicted ester cyclase